MLVCFFWFHMSDYRKVFLYIAVSVDDFIARPDGQIDWLSSVETEGEDYGSLAMDKESKWSCSASDHSSFQA